ncbi:MAG: hypothetical protein EXR75_15200 [Myxococcales bacterium]|nr:hypothetical protein [Myxococcales bacterium]
MNSPHIGEFSRGFAWPLFVVAVAAALGCSEPFRPGKSAGAATGTGGSAGEGGSTGSMGTGGSTGSTSSVGGSGGEGGAASVCGDGNVDAGEQCDDGNSVSGDGCSSGCTLPVCGDAIFDPGEFCFEQPPVSFSPQVIPLAGLLTFDCGSVDAGIDVIASGIATSAADLEKAIVAWSMKIGSRYAVTTSHGVTGTATAMAAGELDGNGSYMDLAVAHIGKFNILKGTGNCQFALHDGGPLTGEGRDIVTLNLDKTGKTDVAAVSWETTGKSGYLNWKLGDGSTTSKVGISGSSYALAAGDLDGDGDDDLAYTTKDTQGSRLVVLTTSFANNVVSFATFAQFTLTAEAMDIQLADLSGDGKLDILVASPLGKDVRVFINNGNAFAGLMPVAIAGGSPTGIAVADFDGDGDKDVALSVAQGPIDDVQLYANNGQGVLTAAGAIDIAQNSPLAIAAHIAAADMSGDGRPDLVIDTQTEIHVLLRAP